MNAGAFVSILYLLFNMIIGREACILQREYEGLGCLCCRRSRRRSKRRSKRRSRRGVELAEGDTLLALRSPMDRKKVVATKFKLSLVDGGEELSNSDGRVFSLLKDLVDNLGKEAGADVVLVHGPKHASEVFRLAGVWTSDIKKIDPDAGEVDTLGCIEFKASGDSIVLADEMGIIDVGEVAFDVVIKELLDMVPVEEVLVQEAIGLGINIWSTSVSHESS